MESNDSTQDIKVRRRLFGVAPYCHIRLMIAARIFDAVNVTNFRLLV